MKDCIRIRRAGPEDSQAIAEIHVNSWRVAYRGIVPAQVLEGLSVEKRTLHVRTELAKSPEGIAVAEVGGRPIGFCGFGDCRDSDKTADLTAEVYAIYLAPTHWRRGIGSMLLNWTEDQLSLAGRHEVVAWVLGANARSRAFYEAQGYLADGTSKTLTIGADLTAVRYAKPISCL